MTGFEVYKKAVAYVMNDDETGFNKFIASLTEEETNEYKKYMDGVMKTVNRVIK